MSGGRQTPFEFATAARILVGPGTLDQIGPIAAQMGRHAFVVTGRTTGRAGRLLDDRFWGRAARLCAPCPARRPPYSHDWHFCRVGDLHRRGAGDMGT